MAHICKDGNRQITKNFTESELYSKSFDAPTCHPLSDKTIEGLQDIRDRYGSPIAVTSTYRTQAGNSAIGGASTSHHLTGEAIDFSFVGIGAKSNMQDFYNDMKCKGSMYRLLRQKGINGIGIYDSFLHIDSRPTPSFWDESAGEWGDTRITSEYMNQIPESGLSSSVCGTLDIESDYGLEGVLAPFDPSNYSGEDGIKSQSQNIKLLLIGSVLLIAGGVVLLASRNKKMKNIY